MKRSIRHLSTLAGLTLALSAAPALAGSLTPIQTYTLTDAAAQDARWFRDQSRVAIAVENTVVIADPAGKALQTLRGPSEPVERLSVSPDGSLVAGISDGVLFVWRVNGGTLLRRWPPAGAAGLFPAIRGAFRADNSLLVLQDDQDAPLLVLNATTGTTTRLAEYGPEDLLTSADGKTALVVDYGEAYLTDTATFKKKGPATVYDDLANATLSPDGTLGALSGDSGEVQVLSLTAQPRTLKTALKTPGLAFLNTDTLMLIEDGRVEQLSVKTGQKVGSGGQSPFQESGLAVSNRGTVLGIMNDFPPSLFAASKPSDSTFLRFPAGRAQDVGLSGTQALAVQYNEAFVLGSSNRALNTDDQEVLTLASAAGVTAALLDTGKGLGVGLIQNGRLVAGPALAAFEDDLVAFELSPNGKYLVTHDGWMVAVTDLATGRTTTVDGDKLDLGDDVVTLASVSADGKEVAVITEGRYALRVDLASGRITTSAQFPEGTEPEVMDMAADGTIAVEVRRGGQAEVWLFKKNATTSFKQLSYPGWVEDLRFSPDGRALAVNGSGATPFVLVLDTVTGNELARSAPLSMYDGGLSWNAAGTQLLVGRGVAGRAGSVTLFEFKR